VAVERSQAIAVTPDRAWSLLSSAALWSLRPERCAFDVPAVPGAARLRVSLAVRAGQVACDVLAVTGEVPGRRIRLSTVTTAPPGAVTFTLSVMPEGDQVRAVIAVRNRVRRGAGLDVRAVWRRQLKAWLGECREVLEGRRAWPADGLPDGVHAVCARRRPVPDAPVVVSATALISAPQARVWQTVWDPETSLLLAQDAVAAGHVPGTPSRQPGEMQYGIHRLPDGRLHPHLLVAQEITDGHSVMVQEAGPAGTHHHPPYPRPEMSHVRS
jgi:hypothetical protein